MYFVMNFLNIVKFRNSELKVIRDGYLCLLLKIIFFYILEILFYEKLFKMFYCFVDIFYSIL